MVCKIEVGDILFLNCFLMVVGYYVVLECMFFVEYVSDEYLWLWEINCKVYDCGKELLVFGVKCVDIVVELNEIYVVENLL